MSTPEGEKIVEITRETFKIPFDSIRSEILSLGTRIEEYLDKVGADVQEWKFSVDQRAGGIDVEVRFRAFVHPRSSKTIESAPPS